MAARYLVILFTLLLLSACSGVDLKPEMGSVRYDFQQRASYEMSKQHKTIKVKLDVEDLELPDEAIRIPELLLDWVEPDQASDITIYVRFSESYLVERLPGVRTEVTYDERKKGTVKDVPIQRAYVRTVYVVEVVDIINDVLIDQYQGAGNYDFEADFGVTKQQDKQLMTTAFNEEVGVARYQLLTDIWRRIKHQYLNNLLVTFGKVEYPVVISLKSEPAFSEAYDELLNNNKKSAEKALKIYSDALKRYQGDDLDEAQQSIKAWLDQGVTVASSILNHQFEDRYPPDLD